MVKPNTPGFQGSETSGVDVTAYHRGDDPVIFFSDAGERTFKGRRNEDPDASVVAVSTEKSMGASSGTFSVTLKPSAHMGKTFPRFLDYLVDDDWIDITFQRHGRPFHVMRGLIEDIQEEEAVAGNGATTISYVLTGRDFGCIFDKTKVWFNRVAAELGEFAAIKIFEGLSAIGDPGAIVQQIIYGFMGALEDVGRANWLLPPDMPGAQETFAQTFIFNDVDFANDPERQGVTLQLMQPNGEGIWQLAQEYSDPMFCEFFCDLSKDGDIIRPDTEVTPEETEMMVFFRDRPFPRNDLGKDSPWFNLPLLEVPRSHMSRKSVTRSTKDRYNAYFVAPQVYQEGGFTKDIMGPLWDELDVRKHGMRPFNVQSRYTTGESNLFNLVSAQRELVRDWHCLSPYFLSGNVDLGRLYPDARIGSRLRLIGQDEGSQEDYYIEKVSHRWTKERGGRTGLGVTRGWVGGDNSYMQALGEVAGRYATVAL